MAKTKVLISYAVTAQLFCSFVFAYVDCWFSYAVAQFLFFHKKMRMHGEVVSLKEFKPQVSQTEKLLT